jgi:hypothetical protein
LAADYAAWSAYNYVLGNPVRFVDLDGRAPQDIIIIGSASYQKQVMSTLLNLAARSNAGFQLVQNAIRSDRDFVIADTRSNIDNGVGHSDNYSVLAFDGGQATADLDAANGANGGSLAQTMETSLAHELAHFENGLGQQGGSVLIDNKGYSTGIPADEPHAVEMENRVRSDFGMTLRTHYGGLSVIGKEAVQKGSSPLGFGLINHNRIYTNSGSSDAAYQYIFGNINSSSESRRNYHYGISGGIDKYLKSGASTQQIRLYDTKK